MAARVTVWRASVSGRPGHDTKRWMQPARTQESMTDAYCTLVPRTTSNTAGDAYRARPGVRLSSPNHPSRSHPWEEVINSRILNFCGLPVTVIGQSSTILTTSGILKCAILPWQ